MKSIKERAKDLCSDISNILIHHYDGYGTEIAEAKAVEDAEELINAIRQEMIEKALSATCTMCSMHINGCLLGEFLGKCDKLNCIRKVMEG